MADTIFKIPKLKGSDNFDIWAIRIENILIKENFYNFILDDYTTPENTESIILESQSANPNEERLDILSRTRISANKATSIIKLSLEDGPLLQTRFISNPYILWVTLKNLYSAQGFSSEFILSKELINTTINTFKGDLEKFLNKFKNIINNLESKNIILPNNFIAALLLNNLNKDYEYIVTIITQTIRINNSEVNVDAIIAQLLDESRRLNSIKKSNNINNSNIYNYNYKSNYNKSNYNHHNNNSNKNKNYTNDIEMALQSKDYKSSKSNNNYNKSKKICNYCKKEGHLESNCFSKQNKSKNLYNTKSIKNIKSINTTSNINNYKTILYTKNSNNKVNTIDFVLDSGASIHTSYIKDLFNPNSLKSCTTSIK